MVSPMANFPEALPLRVPRVGASDHMRDDPPRSAVHSWLASADQETEVSAPNAADGTATSSSCVSASGWNEHSARATTAGGFVKMIAQIGGASAGYPLGMLQQAYGWEGVFGFLAVVSLSAAAAAAPLWTATAQVRIQARNGTVQDFKTMAPSRNNSDKDLFKRFDKNRSLASMGEAKKDK